MTTGQKLAKVFAPKGNGPVVGRFASVPFTPFKKLLSEGLIKEAELLEAYLLKLPPSRETSLALTHLEEVVMWANKAISRSQV